MSAPKIWREPDEESVDLYPGLVVHDGRVSGSITMGRSRLPLWCLTATAIQDGWPEVEANWTPSQYGWDAERFSTFLYDLLELRGEFGRLLLVLADAERCDRKKGLFRKPWWETKRHRERVSAQLRRCLESLSPAQSSSRRLPVSKKEEE